MKIEDVVNIMRQYGDAREKRDPNEIIKVFCENCSYLDKPFNTPIKGLDGIKNYWTIHSFSDHRNVKFVLGKCAVYEDTGYAEFVCNFDQIETNMHVEMRGIIIFTMENNKMKDLREYRITQKN